MKLRNRILLIGFSIAAVGILTTGCKEGDPISDGITPATPVFVADRVTAGDRYVYLRQSSVSAGRIVFDLMVAEIDEPISGIAVTLTYPDDWSRFIDCSDGDLFPPETGDCYYREPGPGTGEVFVGRAIGGPEEATTVVGERVIARLEFLVFAQTPADADESETRIRIEGPNIGGLSAVLNDDIPPKPIRVDWFTGSLLGR